jgi:type VI protein secretion system component Hcp
MALLLKGPFTGSNTTPKGYEGWTPITSMQWGASRGVAGGVPSVISVSEVNVTKTLDRSTAAMAKLMGSATPVTIQIVNLKEAPPGSNSFFAEFTYVLGATLFTGFSTSTGGDTPSESYSFNFQKLSATMRAADGAGTVTVIGTYAFDAVNGTAG